MDGPLGKVPKWAWIAAGGVSVGVIALRVVNSKNKPADVSDPTDATAAGDYGQTGQGFTSGYVDVPYSPGAVDASGGQAIDPASFIEALGSFAQGVQAPHESTADIIGAIAPFMGGGAPQSTTTEAPPAPPQAAPTPPPPAPRPVDKCTGAFPNDAGNGDCYRVECNPKGHAKGRWHFHKNGSSARVSASC
jgi:hypothetical protein